MRHLIRALLVGGFLAGQVLGQPGVPEWAKDAVWYQIFPERFRNGDPSNDPTREELLLPDERPWQVSRWTGDWYALQPWEAAYSDNFYDVVFERRYGGDLQGVLDKLDYLQQLGVTALYFNPLFESISLHKYDASTYHHIDNNFGPDARGDLRKILGETDDPATWRWTAADSLFLKLVAEAHGRGIRLIIDGVFNHCGTRFWAFEDVMKNQQRSAYAEWFDVKRWDDPATTENEFDYKGWWDYKGMPEFRETQDGFVRPVRDYFFHVTKRWMDPDGDGDPSDGVDGWRLDVANDVSHVFWKSWCSYVKSINPDAYIVGEIWDDAAEWLTGDQFDAVMNYRFSRAVVRFFVDTDSRRFEVSDFDEELEDIRRGYPAEVNYVLQNLMDSHDTDRLLSMIVNPNRTYDHDNGVRWNREYNIRAPRDSEKEIQRLIVLFQMTYVGAPMIYNGTEAGMWGADDPDDRKPVVWPDLRFENERTHPAAGRSRPDDVVAFDQGLADYYGKLAGIRSRREALRRGDFRSILIDDEAGVYAFQRATARDTATVVLNNSRDEQSAVLQVAAGSYRDELTGTVVEAASGLAVALRPRSGMVLVKNDK